MPTPKLGANRSMTDQADCHRASFRPRARRSRFASGAERVDALDRTPASSHRTAWANRSSGTLAGSTRRWCTRPWKRPSRAEVTASRSHFCRWHPREHGTARSRVQRCARLVVGRSRRWLRPRLLRCFRGACGASALMPRASTNSGPTTLSRPACLCVAGSPVLEADPHFTTPGVKVASVRSCQAGCGTRFAWP
jgi:hypothetical protein